jgi:hypothetical protein
MGMGRTTESVRIGGLTLHQTANALSAISAEHGDDSPLKTCVHRGYVEGPPEDLREIAEACRKWGSREFSVSTWGVYEIIDDAL